MGNQGNMANLGNAFAAAGPALQQRAQVNKTRQFLAQQDPEYGQLLDAGMSPADVLNLYSQRRYAKPDDPYKAVGGHLFDTRNETWLSPPDAAGANDYSERQRAAQSYGLAPDDPRYQSFILTGKMPREDAQPLTAVDKKAILEADEMVSANENAIRALDQAESISDDANSGWLAGTRATIGNNLPDWMVPDQISSPESSVATTDMDNAVIGQALASLKTIFGGNPTEGERAILLQLQGSSSMPKEVRKRVFARAKELAQRRLEFNRQRAMQLRGGDFYKPQGMQQPLGNGGTTQGGIQWSVEP